MKRKMSQTAAAWAAALCLAVSAFGPQSVQAASEGNVPGTTAVSASEGAAGGEAAPTEDPHPAAYYEPVQTDAIEGWPAGPAIYAESGILVDLDDGRILYAKNIDKQLYPASITKIMTTLLAMENCAPDEQVTFSQHALDSIEWDSSNIGCRLGEVLTMEQCWYGMMLNSANEVCCGVAEHVAGSIEAFVDRMNEKAQSLGCTGTHFNNTNGLPDENHYTTAHDMALIAQAAFANETFRTVTGTKTYQIPATEKYTEIRYLKNHHKMLLPDTDYYYEGCIGGKTGYTEAALNTLVTFAQRDGRTLMCVTMRTQGRQVYTDTASLFDYGFTSVFPDKGAMYLNQTDQSEEGGDGEDGRPKETVSGTSLSADSSLEETPVSPSPAAETSGEEKKGVFDGIARYFLIGLLIVLVLLFLWMVFASLVRRHRRRKRRRRRRGKKRKRRN
ncbi:MAG: D-alanyl-D-alanine carboxypeptidase [Fusicatenibacter sp.]|nr:D-alanyl-D-alanine carboxypeptidase [Fusicatenibacter sp.]